MMSNLDNNAINVDWYLLLVIALVVYIGISIAIFSLRYMSGDNQYKYFFIKLATLISLILINLTSNNLIIIFISWCFSNVVLVSLMIHKNKWIAAKNSGILAAKNYLFSASILAISFVIFYNLTKSTNIRDIISHLSNNNSNPYLFIALILMLIAAMMQSALWPFHKWLISSLNSPTPVSALMHAGIINGGGLILLRFAPLYLQNSTLLTIIFCVGIISALLGTLWKLMQNDIKRMLACSTMGQMGFMFLQCGLGLFPAALAHLIWHGMFKAYLFLASNSAAKERRFDLSYPPNILTFFSALFCGLIGSIMFCLITKKSLFILNTNLVIIFISFISIAQFAMPLLRGKTLQKIPLTLLLCTIFGSFYGFSVHIIELVAENISQPQPLSIFHLLGMSLLLLTWLSVLFLKHNEKRFSFPNYFLQAYVTALNSSQPHYSTITTNRNHYKY